MQQLSPIRLQYIECELHVLTQSMQKLSGMLSNANKVHNALYVRFDQKSYVKADEMRRKRRKKEQRRKNSKKKIKTLSKQTDNADQPCIWSTIGL